MTWLEYALTYALLTSLHVPLIKRITTGLTTGRQYAFINSLLSMPLLVGLMLADLVVHHQIHIKTAHMPLWPMKFGVLVPYVTVALQISWTFWVFVLLAAWIQCAGLRRAVEAYSEGELSIVAPMGALMPLFVGLFAWIFLGERLTLKAAFGVGAIVVGAYTIIAKVDRADGLAGWFKPFKYVTSRRGLRVYLEARAIWVFFPIALKPALTAIRPLSPYVVSCITVGFMCLYAAPWKREERVVMAPVLKSMVAGLRRGPDWSRLRPTCRHLSKVVLRKRPPYGRKVHGGKLLAAFCLSAVILALQQFVELNAYVRTNVAAVSAIFKLDVPLIVLWGVLFFHEKSPVRRVLSGLLMALGVWLLS